MTTQQPNGISQKPDESEEGRLSTVKAAEVTDVLTTQIRTVDSIINSLNFQLLGNIDMISDNDGLFDGTDKLKTLCESMLKKPFRRQVGRLKGVKRILQELSKSCEG
jgi:hypothetical protein